MFPQGHECGVDLLPDIKDLLDFWNLDKLFMRPCNLGCINLLLSVRLALFPALVNKLGGFLSEALVFLQVTLFKRRNGILAQFGSTD